MDDQKKYGDLLENEEELFRRFMERGTTSVSGATGESTPVYEYTAPVSDEDTELTKQQSTEYVEQEEYIEEDDEISGIKDFLPDLSPLFSKDAKKLNFSRKVGLFISLLRQKENAKRISCLLIPLFLVLILLFNILTPSREVSEKENRTLASFPKLSAESLSNGAFMDGFEDYISDQFVFRNSFVSAKRRYEVFSGKEENHGIIFGSDGYLIENSANHSMENVPSNIDGINALSSVKRYNVAVAVVPSTYEVMKDKLPDHAYSEIYSELQKEIKNGIKNAKVADVNDVLSAHKNEYIYYRTDHHQTALGSYYLYSALGKTLGYEPYELKSFKVETVSNDFYGTAWSNSGFAATKKDEIHKYTLSDSKFKYSVSFPEEKKKMNSLYNDKMLDGKDKYAYYLDGNHAVTVVSSNCNTGKKLAVIKDSYAHSLVPFLANHYNTIHLIDLRYFNGDIFEYLYSNNLKDCLFLYNHNTFMTDSNLSKISEFAKTSSFTSVPDIKYGVVPETDPVDVSYFDDAVFVGDSLTIGIQNFSGFNSTFLCMGGLNTKNLDTDPLPNGKTTMQYIRETEHIGKLYIMLGTNEVAFNEMEEYLTRYSQFIDDVRKQFPDVLIYIESIMPVTKSTSQGTGIKNDKIIEYNKKLLEMAEEKQCYYIDLHAYFRGEDGALPDNIGSDGIHLGPEKYRELAGYLQAHAVPVSGVVKIEGEKQTKFADGGKYDSDAIAQKVLSAVKFKDDLIKVSDTLISSNYKVDFAKLCSASLYIGSGVTAEEVAVFEAVDENEAKTVEKLAKERIERKKKDYENYIPEEMPKLNSPYIVRKGNVVIVCIADNADKNDLIKLIK